MLNELLKSLSKSLIKNNIPYMIIGGQAALLYREPRFTNDIDITLGIGIEEVHKLFNLCKEIELMILVDNPDDFILQTMVLPTYDNLSNLKIDFIFSSTLYEHEAISRANIITLDGTDIYFCSLEDIIILKIFAGRPRDIEDVGVIIRKNPNYNRQFILKNLDELGKAVDIDLISRLLNIGKSEHK